MRAGRLCDTCVREFGFDGSGVLLPNKTTDIDGHRYLSAKHVKNPQMATGTPIAIANCAIERGSGLFNLSQNLGCVDIQNWILCQYSSESHARCGLQFDVCLFQLF